jgi:hypothetical protein
MFYSEKTPCEQKGQHAEWFERGSIASACHDPDDGAAIHFITICACYIDIHLFCVAALQPPSSLPNISATDRLPCSLSNPCLLGI